MEITKIELTNFRNHIKQQVNFKSGVNVVCGKNAQGKTNLIEAVYFCVVGKSFRASREKEVINLESDFSKIKIYIKKSTGTSTVEIMFSKKQNKSIKINDIPIKKIGELLGEFNGVFFAPSELKLIKESPDDRRRFMDIDISQTSKEYFYLLSRYDKILKHRNKQLKANLSKEKVKDVISIFDEQLADCALKISKYRENFVLKLAPFAKLAHEYLTDKKEVLSLEYITIKEKTKQEILQKLDACFEKDFALGYTSYGVHRDDIKVMINNVDVRTFGSQGQQRTAALSLKLAELEIIKEKTNTMPVLLLDDVLSELDDNRKLKLLNFCKKAQTLITCTEFNFNVNHNKIVIEDGNIISQN